MSTRDGPSTNVTLSVPSDAAQLLVAILQDDPSACSHFAGYAPLEARVPEGDSGAVASGGLSGAIGSVCGAIAEADEFLSEYAVTCGGAFKPSTGLRYLVSNLKAEREKIGGDLVSAAVQLHEAIASLELARNSLREAARLDQDRSEMSPIAIQIVRSHWRAVRAAQAQAVNMPVSSDDRGRAVLLRAATRRAVARLHSELRRDLRRRYSPLRLRKKRVK